ncbi:2-oxoglutarate dehydrogenase complex dihydrolipoyllysine-residue succinyltransferase [bacterium]|nr:2-oxoglutarate dehydrogenase complex dihydrolipoyllysine-residue succinyltransferase [Candidatus Pseudothioglobus singularis]MDB4598142.1 2-oxoglutarate dehydrogenase complex dihydrolipoyllysine-residue succinyltransferase [Candidatus Pseudothioglobus singularis]MDC3375286.1 2-oxoglutarate dehydrogenase complex dihydrolipoyllysine-residue succinyltransferase [bacterium]
MKEVKVPVLPESINEATVAAWHKKPGDSVEVDDVIVEIETDKVVLEVPAEESGILTEILAEEGETVNEQQVLGLLDDSADASNDDTPQEEQVAQEEPVKATQVSSEEAPKEEAKKEPVAAPEIPREEPAADPVSQSSQPSSNRMEERVPMTRIRKTIANRLHSATQNTAMLTTFNEVDMSEILAMRASYKEAFEKKYSVKLGFMSFFVKAAVESLKKFPTVNAYLDGDDIVYHAFCDVSVAVSSDRGLVVPVLRDAHKMGMHDIEKGIMDYAVRAQDGTLGIEEMSGGTFTISNGGVFGSLMSTPILNSPQSAILGMHKTQDRPVAVNGEVVIRPMMYLALSYDHRIIDGKEAVQFLISIKEALEDPARLLLKV